MKEEIIISADIISRFCRLQTNIKKDIPIRSSEMGVLIYIETSTEPVTPLMISSFFGISKPSVTDMVNSLLEKEYLKKIPSKEDKRSYNLELTEKGHNLVGTAHKEYFRSIELLKKKLGNEEFKRLIEMLEKANDILDEERER